MIPQRELDYMELVFVRPSNFTNEYQMGFYKVLLRSLLTGPFLEEKYVALVQFQALRGQMLIGSLCKELLS